MRRSAADVSACMQCASALNSSSSARAVTRATSPCTLNRCCLKQPAVSSCHSMLECNGIRMLCMSYWSKESMTWVQHTHLQICRGHYFKSRLRQTPKEGMLHQCCFP